jgi:hypothetical protein
MEPIKRICFVALMAMLMVFAVDASAQCPMCKTALKSNINGKKGVVVGNGINKGILFLLSTPYILVGAAGFAWYRYRKNGKNA